jgi:hypothetical protein
MSAVLQSPALPTLLNMEDLKAYIDSEIEKGISKALPAAVEKVLSDPENPIFIRAVENVLAISDLKILKRLYTHDKMLGLVDLDLEDEEDHEPNIPEQIKELSNRIEQPLNKPIESIKIEMPVIPTTTLEHKAMKLVERLKVKPRSRTGEVFLDNSELTKFLTTELPEELRSNDSNLRRVKKRVIEKAKSLFPNAISINKSKYGRHETRIIFKEPYQSNRNGTIV